MSLTLIKQLQNPALFSHVVKAFSVIETHSSWVLLTGVMAYKIKKPVDFGFLDFSTLEKRQYYCQLEFELNQKLAPMIYQQVVKITGTQEEPLLQGKGEVIEYAIQMCEFPQSHLLSALLAENKLSFRLLDATTACIARFHQQASRTRPEVVYGEPDQIHEPTQQNFSQIHPFLTDETDLVNLDTLRLWSDNEFSRLRSVFEVRKKLGYVRACHGDMHLGNMVLMQRQPVLFDAIEFNEAFRWIDTMADLGFLAMDFKDKQYPHYAHRLISMYLEYTGDYHGLQVLSYYIVYRAMVRAKVALLRASQSGLSEAEQKTLWQMYRGYIQLALTEITPRKPYLIIMHGFSGSGKSTIARALVEKLGAIQLRSDVERKRISGVNRVASSRSSVNQGIYRETMTQRIYQRLLDLAEQISLAGFGVIVDATFLQYQHRLLFADLAKRLTIPFVIMDCQADDETLKLWILRRLARRKDASEATLSVLAQQKKTAEPLSEEEQQRTFVVCANTLGDSDIILARLQQFLR